MNDCLFCKIVAGDVPAQKIWEDDDAVAFKDIRPQAPVHVLVVPRRHVASLEDAADGDGPLLGRLLLAAQRLARELNVADGYRVVTNCGGQAGQSVFHLHFHLLGGRVMEWPPG